MAGVRGDLNDAWSYDAYGSFYDTDLFNSNNGYLSIAALAPRAERLPDRCGRHDLAAGCMPWNIWQDGGVTQQATDYLFAFGLATGTATQAIGSANMTGDLGAYGLQLPTAEEGVGVAFGAEYRRDTFGFLPDQTLGSGDLSGSGGASPDDQRGHRRDGNVRRVPRPAGAGRDGRPGPRVRDRLPVLGLRALGRRRHLQVRPAVGADREHPAPRLLQPRDPCAEPDRAVQPADGDQHFRVLGRPLRGAEPRR